MTNREEKYLEELQEIMKHLFFTIARVDLLEDEVYILHSINFPEFVSQKYNWTEHLGNYHKFVGEKVLEDFSAQNLLEKYEAGNEVFAKDIYYMMEKHREWLTVEAFLKSEQDRPYATIIVRKSTKEHLQKNIIEKYVYNKCDCFICLDARNNSYEMFSGKESETMLPKKKSEHYVADVVEYIRNYVVQEEQIDVMYEMSLERMIEQLEDKEVHSFSCGMMDPIKGYRRKLVEYQYYDRQAQMILLSRIDITDLYMESQEKETELLSALERACTDSLTGLLNHQGTVDQISFCLKKDKGKSALMFVDMDNFKDVNDSLGHITGDELLREVAEILKKGVRTNDLVGRVGGDEFCVFLRNIRSESEVTECAGRLCKGIRHLSVGFGFPVSCSIGVALAPRDGQTYKALTENADKRLYNAKDKGKNQIAIK